MHCRKDMEILPVFEKIRATSPDLWVFRTENLQGMHRQCTDLAEQQSGNRFLPKDRLCCLQK